MRGSEASHPTGASSRLGDGGARCHTASVCRVPGDHVKGLPADPWTRGTGACPVLGPGGSGALCHSSVRSARVPGAEVRDPSSRVRPGLCLLMMATVTTVRLQLPKVVVASGEAGDPPATPQCSPRSAPHPPPLPRRRGFLLVGSGAHSAQRFPPIWAQAAHRRRVLSRAWPRTQAGRAGTDPGERPPGPASPGTGGVVTLGSRKPLSCRTSHGLQDPLYQGQGCYLVSCFFLFLFLDSADSY